MKKLLLACVFSTLFVASSFALEFSDDTIFLNASNEAACKAQWGSFTAWENETYCTTTPSNILTEKTMKAVSTLAQRVSAIVQKKPDIYGRLVQRLSELKFQYKEDQKIKKAVIIEYFVGALDEELPQLSSYEECETKWGAIMESRPQQCMIFGQHFTQELTEGTE